MPVQWRRRDVVKAVGATAGLAGGALAVGATGSGGEEDLPADQPARDPAEPYEAYSVHRVPENYDTIQAAVNAAEPEDLVLVGPGVYNEAVTVSSTPRLTIRGTDRNEVVLDGEFSREDAVLATVDDVVVENMTARNYQRNGFFWSSVTGWRGSYLTAYNNRLYGIYCIDSLHGRFDNSYASGHTDSGFYVGQCKPCHGRLENVRAENNALGYSGTNAGGYLTIADSTFSDNLSGIVPNSLDSEADPPQDSCRIENNVIERNNNQDAPSAGFAYASYGMGVLIAGGVDNEVRDNEVRDHANFGLVAGIIQDENFYRPKGNRFADNVVENSGRADLAEAAPSGGGNVFEDNEYDTARPAGLDDGTGLTTGGDPWVSMVMLKQYRARSDLENPEAWREGPEPPFEELEGMPDPEDAPPRPAVRR